MDGQHFRAADGMSWTPYRPTDPYDPPAPTRQSPSPPRQSPRADTINTDHPLGPNLGSLSRPQAAYQDNSHNPASDSGQYSELDSYSNLEVAHPIAEEDDPYNPADPFTSQLTLHIPDLSIRHRSRFQSSGSLGSTTPAPAIPPKPPRLQALPPPRREADNWPYGEGAPYSRSTSQPIVHHPTSRPPSVPQRSISGPDITLHEEGPPQPTYRAMTRQSHDYTSSSMQQRSQSPPTRAESPTSFAQNRYSVSRTTLRSTSTTPSMITASNTTIDGADGSKIVVGLDYGTTYTGLFSIFTPGILLALLLKFGPT